MILTSDLILYGYSHGVFPMADSRDGDIYWYRPEERGIVPLEQIRVSHTLRKTLRSGKFIVTHNRCFGETVARCAARDETWISFDIEEAYNELHRLGLAHSLEVWSDGELAGGLYGVALGGAFFGESMFHVLRDASKVGFVYLVRHLASRGFLLLDTQYTTPHLISMGAIEVGRQQYESILSKALKASVTFAAPDALSGRLEFNF